VVVQGFASEALHLNFPTDTTTWADCLLLTTFPFFQRIFPSQLLLRRGQQSHPGARASLLVKVANVMTKLQRVAMEQREEGSDIFQERLLAARGDMSSIEQSVVQFYKALLKQDDALKTVVRKLHSVLINQEDEEEFLRTSDMLGERHLQQDAAVSATPLDDNAVSAMIQDLTTAVQEPDMDVDTIMTGLQSMIATIHDALEADTVDAANLEELINNYCLGLGDPILCQILLSWLTILLWPITIPICLILCDNPAGKGKDSSEWCEAKCGFLNLVQRSLRSLDKGGQLLNKEKES
jgi:hypothetical protein